MTRLRTAVITSIAALSLIAACSGDDTSVSQAPNATADGAAAKEGGTDATPDGSTADAPPADAGKDVAAADAPPADAGNDVSAADAPPADAGNDVTADTAPGDDVKDAATDAQEGGDASPVEASTPVRCGRPADCAAGEICGASGLCHAGMCSAANPCVFGYTCAGGACQGANNACDKDVDCQSGSLCIAGASGGGVCTTAANQCFDQEQCGLGEVCVSGKCALTCTSNAECRGGFGCDTMLGTCTVPTEPCSVTNDCGTSTDVCVAGACVPASLGGACTNPGDVWTENGCIPNQAASFNCTVDGQLGSGAGSPGVSCAEGHICVHRSCLISCDAPNQNVCTAQVVLNTCKPIADNGVTYNVCGTTHNLGNQCGPGASGNPMCSDGFTCIDGYCK